MIPRYRDQVGPRVKEFGEKELQPQPQTPNPCPRRPDPFCGARRRSVLRSLDLEQARLQLCLGRAGWRMASKRVVPCVNGDRRGRGSCMKRIPLVGALGVVKFG